MLKGFIILICASIIIATALFSSSAEKRAAEMLSRLNLQETQELLLENNQKEIEKGRIFLIGDSRIERWINFPAMLNVKVLNLGVGGATSSETIKLLQTKTFEAMPEKVIIQLGVNDLKVINFYEEKTTVISSSLIRNIKIILKYFIDAGSQVYLTTIICPSRSMDEWRIFWKSSTTQVIKDVNKRLREEASKLVTIIDLERALGCSPNLSNKFAVDSLHLNKAGYEVINNEISKSFKHEMR